MVLSFRSPSVHLLFDTFLLKFYGVRRLCYHRGDQDCRDLSSHHNIFWYDFKEDRPPWAALILINQILQRRLGNAFRRWWYSSNVVWVVTSTMLTDGICIGELLENSFRGYMEPWFSPKELFHLTRYRQSGVPCTGGCLEQQQEESSSGCRL